MIPTSGDPDAAKETVSMDEKGPTMDSKFRRVLVAATRAEQIMRGARPKVEAGKRKPTRVALEEVDQSMIPRRPSRRRQKRPRSRSRSRPRCTDSDSPGM
jgi:DNA-directed RNA polymerase omega subunit